MNTGRIEIRDFTEEKKKTHRDSRTALLFLISGILGILFFLENMAGSLLIFCQSAFFLLLCVRRCGFPFTGAGEPFC